MSLKRYFIVALILSLLLSTVNFNFAMAAVDDIRFDFETDSQGVALRNSTVCDKSNVESGKFVVSTSKSKVMSGRQIQIKMPKIDFGDGGYYMHVNARYEFSKGVNLSSHFACIFDSDDQEYGTVVGTDYSKWSDFETVTYDLTKITGEKIPAWYLALSADSSDGTGSVYVESIVFSKSSKRPSVTPPKEEAEPIELFNNSESEAVRLLVSMGIMNYDKDTGVFWDESPITRVQMAGLLCRLYGLTAEKSGERLFEDVMESDRASVETIVRNGYMSGYDDGKFGADDYITGNQLIKIFVTMLGGQSAAENIGGFPEGYFEIGKRLGLNYATVGKLNEPVTRLNVAETIYDAMHADYLSISGFKGDAAIYGTQHGKTFLSEVRGIYRIEGIMSADDVTSITSSTGCGENRVVIDGVVAEDPHKVTSGFIGYNVVAYEERTDDDLPGKIIYIEESNDNDVLKLDGKELIFENVVGEKVTYWKKDKLKHIRLATAVDMLFNGVSENYSTEKLKSDSNDEITFVDNNDDGAYDVVIVYDYEDCVTNVVRTEENEISLQYGEPTLRFEDDVVRIYDGDTSLTLDDLQSNQVLSVAKSINTSGDKLYTIRVGTAGFSGVVESVWSGDDERILEIGGIEYTLGDYAEELIKQNKLVDIGSGDDATFYRNYAGDISIYKIDTKGENVACLLGYYIDENSMTPEFGIRLYTQTGKIITLVAKDKVRINDVKRKISSIKQDKELLEKLDFKQLVKYECSGEVLKSLVLPESGYSDTKFSKDVEYQRLNCNRTTVLSEMVNGEYTAEKYRLTSNTVTFRVPVKSSLGDGHSYNDATLYRVLKGAAISRGASGMMELYDVLQDGAISYAIWTYKPYENRLEYGHNLAVVTGTGKTLNDDDEVVDVVYGYDENGTEVELRLRSDAVLLDGLSIDSLKNGDIVNYFKNHDGDVFQMKLRCSADTQEQVAGVSSGSVVTNILLCVGKVAFESNEQFSVYTGDIRPDTPLDVAGLVCNTGSAVYLCEDDILKKIEFEEIEKDDKICAVLDEGNKTRLLVVYR